MSAPLAVDDPRHAAHPGKMCAHTWPWTLEPDRPERAKWVGHVCGLAAYHAGRHRCLAKECRSWHA